MSSLIAPLFRGRVHYAWIVVAVTFLTMLASAGIRSTPGVTGATRQGSPAR